MRVIFIFIFFVCLSCSFDSKSVKQNNSYSTSSKENFGQFIKKFSSDKGFQLTRTQFPLVMETVEADLEQGGNMDKKSISAIQKLDWEHYYYDERDFPNEKVKIVINSSDSIVSTVVIRGVDSGTSITHFFESTNLGWFLVKITDASD